MDGHGIQTGGVVVDSGNFDWMANRDRFPGLTTPDDSYHGIVYAERFGKSAYIVKAVAQLMRDLGAQAAPMNAFFLSVSLESLHLRIRRHCENALAVASWLEKRPEVAWINYPSLPSSPDYPLAQKYMPNGTCGVIAFGLKGDRQTAIDFMDRLRFVSIATHVADARSCILHPASHTHRQLSDEQLRAAGIPPELVRLSCGIEDASDIIADLQQALEGAAR